MIFSCVNVWGLRKSGFLRTCSVFDTFHRFQWGKWTNRSPPIRYSESPRSNLFPHVPFVPRSLERTCYKGVVFNNFCGIFGFLKTTKNFNPELISKDLELPESHWTSPLGPLAGCGGLGSLNGAKHSLLGSFSAQIGVKKRKFTEFIESIEILHF